MKIFYFTSDKPVNIGDAISPHILEYFTHYRAELASCDESGKLLMVGSLLDIVKKNDIICGIGSNKPDFILNIDDSMRFLMVRGPLTRLQINGVIPEIYGDPALLLPLMYNPEVEQTEEVGYIPHYIDKPLFKDCIDIEQDWKSFVREIKKYKKIVSSTLHGIVIAEAYGIPVKWVGSYNRIEGNQFKYQDYFLGTGRKAQEIGTEIEPIKNLKEIQTKIIKAISMI